MFENLKMFWENFITSLKTAYSKVYKNPVETTVQDYRDITKTNLLAICVNKLTNLAMTEASFEVDIEELTDLKDDLQSKRYEITSEMLANGDCYIFPAVTSGGRLYHSVLKSSMLRILSVEADEIKEAYGIIDWHQSDNNSKIYYLLRHHTLLDNGNLELEYLVIDGTGNRTSLPEWDELTDGKYIFENANHIGFGRYKSPVSARGNSMIYGVPLNYGCGEIEKDIADDLLIMRKELKNGQSVIFTDPRNLLKDAETKQFKFAENIIPIQQRSGITGNNVDIFNPELRTSSQYAKLVNDLSLYEKQIGTSKGILTDNESTLSATATAVKRANSDTTALLDRIHNAIDSGNKMTLEADAVFLSISTEDMNYSSDYYDPFEDPSEQWQRLREGLDSGAVEVADLTMWLFPSLSPDDVEAKLQRISDEKIAEANSAIDRLLANGA